MAKLRFPNSPLAGRFYYWAFIGILLWGLGLRLLHLDKGIWLDEFLSIKRIFSEDFLYQLRFSNHPPLYFILLRLWSHINPSEQFLRVPSVIFGIATVAVVMKWLKRYSALGSLLAGLYCATLPPMLRYSQEIRGYSLLLFATALSFLSASKIAAEPEKKSGYIALSLSLTAAVATHAVGIMVPASICLYIVFTSPTLTLAQAKRLLLSMSLPLFVFIWLFFIVLEKTDIEPTTWWMPSISPHLLLSTAKLLFGLDEAQWLAQAIRNIFPAWPRGVEVAFGIVALALAGYWLWFGSWKQSLPFLAAAIFNWLQMIAYSIFVLPIFLDRTALAGMIPFIGFLGLHIATIQARRVKILSAIAIFLLCMVFSVGWIAKTRHPSASWREISPLLASAWQPGDTIIVFPDYIQGILRYYVNLSAEAVIPFRIGGDIVRLQSEIRRRVVDRKGQRGPLRVFVVIRHAGEVKKHPGAYHHFLDLLQAELGQPSSVIKAGDLSLRRYDLYGGESL